MVDRIGGVSCLLAGNRLPPGQVGLDRLPGKGRVRGGAAQEPGSGPSRVPEPAHFLSGNGGGIRIAADLLPPGIVHERG